MSKLSRDAVLKLAKLSRLKLTDDETERFTSELSAILDYVEMLESADVTGLAPTYQVGGLKNVMRSDTEVAYQSSPKDLLKGAPEIKDDQFKVQRVLD